MSIMLAVLFTVGLSAQCSDNAKGNWYIGTGDIANEAWTEWSLAPTVGYGITEKLMVGMSVSQADSSAEMIMDLHARYFIKGYFLYASAPNLDTEKLSIGLGKMFTFHKGIYIDPKVVYNTNEKTTNLMLGVGLTF